MVAQCLQLQLLTEKFKILEKRFQKLFRNLKFSQNTQEKQ